MKKLCFFICAVVASTASADNTITSKEYVDGQVAGLQTQIPAKNTNTVVTNTGTAGTIGEKAIYDTTAAYGAQSDALVTAGAFNSAVQNALESEFVCVEWLGDVHDNAHCLLYEVKNAYRPSKNMFDKNAATDGMYAVLALNGQLGRDSRFSATDYISVEPGKTYTITNVRSDNADFGNGIFYYDANRAYLRGHGCNGLKCWATPQDGEVYIRFNLLTSQKDVVQMEQGTLATPYVPYGNVYMPQAN